MVGMRCRARRMAVFGCGGCRGDENAIEATAFIKAAHEVSGPARTAYFVRGSFPIRSKSTVYSSAVHTRVAHAARRASVLACSGFTEQARTLALRRCASPQ